MNDHNDGWDWEGIGRMLATGRGVGFLISTVVLVVWALIMYRFRSGTEWPY